VYDEVPSIERLTEVANAHLAAYNSLVGVSSSMKLVLFREALEHLCRICRVLRLSRGSMLLVGVSGSGR
jgi:dynein heavy chain